VLDRYKLEKPNLLDKVGAGMDGHPELIEYVHKVRYEITERHGESVLGMYEFVGINHPWVRAI
jgi:hypothetical protein